MKKQIATFGMANIACAILGMFATLWTAKLAGPNLMGVFNALQLLIVYAPLLALGIFNGLNRELPYSIGRGKREEAAHLAAVALGVCLVICAVSLVGIVISACFAASWGYPIWLLGLGVFALIVPISLYRTYLEVTYRTSNDFVWLSISKVITAVAGLFLVGLLFVDVELGLFGRVLLLTLLGTYLLSIKKPFVVNPTFDLPALKRLLSVGLPIFVVGYLFIFFTNIDRIMILGELDQTALGLYTPAIIILQGMTILPSSVAQVVYPRAAELYGREGRLSGLKKMLFLPIAVLFILQIPLVVALWLFMPELIGQFMPEFKEGAEAARWALLVGLSFSLTTPAVLFNVARRQLLYSIIMIVSIFVIFTWNYAWNDGLTGIAISMLAGGVSFSVLTAITAWLLIQKDSHDKEEKTYS